MHHALDGVGRVLGHRNARSGRAGKRHQIHIGVAAEHRANERAVAVNQIEYASRVTRLVHKLGYEFGRQRRVFAGLEHHGAASQKRRREFGDDLVERPVPGRDQHAHANGLAQQLAIGAAAGLPWVVFGRFERGLDVAWAAFGLGVIGPVPGRAHLGAQGLGHFGVAALKGGLQLLQQLGAVRQAGLAKALEGAAGGGHSAVGVVCAAHHHLAHHRLVARADHRVHRVRAQRFNPGAVNVEIAMCHGHFFSPNK